MHQQNGRHSLSGAIQFSFRPMGLVHSPPHGAAQHLPGHLNVRADRESCLLLDSSDWKLDPAVFQLILQRWGPLEIALFTSRLTYQLKQFVSWRPDPLAIHSDAFSMNWHNIHGYAFPPFTLIGRCLQQIVLQNVEQLILIAPVWPSQPWYTLLLQLCIDHPLLFPMSPTVLTRENQSHPLPNLQLETIGKCYKTANILESTRNILLAAWQKNTTSAYASAWNKWVSWCDPRKINPLSAPIGSILEFLKDQFEDGKAYRTLNVYCFTLSTLLPKIDSH